MLKRFVHGIAFALVFVLFAVSAAIAINTGYQERVYYAEVGTRLGALASSSDTLFLEPAGYIPFYSGLKTFDEVGLASPAMTAFRKHDLSWFAAHYVRIEEFHYADVKRTAPFAIRWLVRLGSRQDYVLFKRKGRTASG